MGFVHLGTSWKGDIWLKAMVGIITTDPVISVSWQSGFLKYSLLEEFASDQ